MDGPGLSSLAANLDFHFPQFDSGVWLQLIIMVVALVLCSIASAAETALTSLSRIKLKNLLEEGDRTAAKIENMLADPNIFLATILVVNSVAVIVASSMATALALRFTESLGELFSTVAISLFVLIFCEITPKTAAVQNPLRWARILIGPVRVATWLLRPLVLSLNVVTSVFVRLMGGHIKHKGPFVTEEELRLLVTVSEEEGVLEQEETEMIRSIFAFADTTAREVMVPRIDMVTLSSEVTVTQAVDLALQGGFSRIPVYEDAVGVDEIIGILYTKDMLRQMREGHDNYPIRNLLRSAYFVPETKKLDDLLREIRQNRIHMAIIVDEYGSVAGLVTIEDLVEEIVGDIQDEYDHEEILFERVSENEYVINAKMSIYDFNELMDTKLADVDYETVGGFVYSQLDKIPGVGDTISYEDMTFTVLATRGRRILKIRVERKQEEERIEGKSDLLLLPSPGERGAQIAREETSEQPSRYEYKGA
jgi:CBS domain containing-hemolysin-like protein